MAELAWTDRGYMGKQPRRDAQAYGVELRVIKLTDVKKGSMLLPKRWIVERSFAWAARFRRLARLRATARCAARIALRGLRHPHADKGNFATDDNGKCITRSNDPNQSGRRSLRMVCKPGPSRLSPMVVPNA